MMRLLDMYIVNLRTGTVMDFIIIPDGPISESLGVTWGSQQIPGSTRTYYGYDNTGPRSVNFSVRLHDDYCKFGIKQSVQNLKALAYPEYDGYVYPPECYVRIGNFLRFKGLCDSVSLSWERPIRNNQYLVADLSLSFQVVHNLVYSAFDVEGGSG